MIFSAALRITCDHDHVHGPCGPVVGTICCRATSHRVNRIYLRIEFLVATIAELTGKILLDVHAIIIAIYINSVSQYPSKKNHRNRWIPLTSYNLKRKEHTQKKITITNITALVVMWLCG